MKKYLSVIPLVLLLCFVVGCQNPVEEVAEEPAVDIEAETEAVKEVFWISQRSGETKNIDLLMSTVADDATLPRGSKEAFREYYEEWFSKGNYWKNSSIDKVEVSASGDLAYITFRWEYFNDEKGEESTGKGRSTMVFKKQADGTWKIAVV